MIDRWLRRVYERGGSNLVLVLIVAVMLNAAIGVAIAIYSVGNFLEGTASEYIRGAALAVAGTAVAGGITALPAIPGIRRSLVRWFSEPSTETAVETWNFLAGFPARAVRLGVVVFSVVFIPYVFWTRWELGLAYSDLPWLFLGVEMAILFAGMLDYFVFERVVRVVLRDVAAYLPPDFEPQYIGVSLRGKLLTATLLTSAITALVVASVETSIEDPSERLAVGILVAIAVTGSVGLLPANFVAESMLAPIRRLTRAARQVGEGDLEVSIPPVAADETAVISHSFNNMVRGLKRQAEELRASRARIVTAADAERRRLERDLHDGAQQHLVLLNLKLGLLERQAADPETRRAVAELKTDLQRGLDELRDLAHGIYPAVLENEGLAGGLADAAERAAIPTTLSWDGAGRYPAQIEAAVYFCCLEALQNASKHAGESARATISVFDRDGRLHFEVTDDGAGFDQASVDGSAGLQNMIDRIGALGGELGVQSNPGSGTRVAGSVPLGR